MTPVATKCSPIALLDTPTAVDEFCHTNVAKALAETIAFQQDGCAVALTGSWGSGKSSVIAQATDILQKDLKAETKIFVFDAWAHQGDPLRRVFLEQIIDFAIAEKWLAHRAKWRKLKENLNKRFEEVISETQPVLSWWGVLVAVTLFFVPIGFQLFGKYDRERFNHPRLAAAGLCVAVLPLFVALSAWIVEVVRRLRAGEELGKALGDTSMLSLLVTRTIDRHHSTTFRTPEPTSVEFQSYFRALMADMLRHKARKLVVVIDNLDRVDEEVALSIWATMKAFFDLAGSTAAKWSPRFWLIVPFDREGIQSLWANTSNGRSTQSFIDKTFQLEFRVAPPLMTDWQKFMFRSLNTALPEHDESDFHLVIRLFDRYRVLGRTPPTPREIKLFINSLGALHRQWQHDVSLSIQALYLCLAPTHGAKFTQLLQSAQKDDELLLNLPPALKPDEWRTGITALHFNVTPPARALQVALAEPLRNALVNGNEKATINLSAREGFWECLEQTVEGYSYYWMESRTDELANVAFVISTLPDHGGVSVRIWNQLRTAVVGAKKWAPFNEPLAWIIHEVSSQKSKDALKG